MFSGAIVLIKSPSFKLEPDLLSLGITVDLLLTIPIVYFLLIRKTQIPKTTVLPVMVLGIVIGTYALPESNQTYVDLFKTWIVPVIEVSVLTWLILKVRGAIKKYSHRKHLSQDFYTTLIETCYEVLPKKLVLPLATEVAVIYYGFINWSTKTLDENEFTYHKNSGSPALFGAFIFILAIETTVIHLILGRWSEIAAWVLTSLSIYAVIQVLGFAKSLARRPIIVHEERLILRYGILNETEIDFEDIDSVQLSQKPLEKDEHIRSLSPLGELEPHNVIIYLKKENRLHGLYGLKKNYKILAFHIDNVTEFKKQMDIALQQLVN